MSARLVIKPNCVVRVREEDEIMMMFFFKTSARWEFGIQCLGGGGERVDPSPSRVRCPRFRRPWGGRVYMQNYVGFSGIPERREMERANSSESTCATHSGILFCFSTGSIFVCVCLCVFAIREKGVCDIRKQTEASQMPFDPPPPPLPHL